MTFGHRKNKVLINKIFEPFRVSSTREKASIFFNETIKSGKARNSRIELSQDLFNFMKIFRKYDRSRPDREPIVRKEPESVGAFICQFYQMFPVPDTVLHKSKHQLVFSHIQLVDTKLLRRKRMDIKAKRFLTSGGGFPKRS